MATLLMQSSNNFTSTNWKTIDTTTANAFLNSEAANTTTTTSYFGSTAFTPGTVTYEGVMVRIAAISSSPSGTFDVQLWNNTDSSQLANVNCNVTDIPMPATTLGGGWVYFKFGSPVTTTAAKAYLIRVRSSVATQVTVYRDATTGNWSRALVTNTAAVAPAASDNLIISGYITAAATTTTIDCVMDNTSSTAYGTLEVASYSTFKLQNSASTAYVYTQGASGTSYFTGNSVTEFGTVGTPIQSTSSFTITAGSSAAAGNIWIIRSPASFSFYGSDVRGSRVTRAAADFANGATSITTTTSTGWKNGDVIAMGASARSATPSVESKALTADASGTTLTIAAVGTGKSGTAPTQIPLVNLTSNAKMKGTSTTNTFIIQMFGAQPTLKFGNVEFTNMGSATTLLRGISVQASAFNANAVFYIYRCSFHDCHASAIVIDLANATSLAGDIQLTENVFYSINQCISCASINTTPTTYKVNNNTAIGGASPCFVCSDETIEIKNNIVNGVAGTNAFTITMPATNTATIDNNFVECCANQGFNITLTGSTISNLTALRCNTYGVVIVRCTDSRINGITAFGCATAGVLNNAIWDNTVVDGMVTNAGTTNTQPVGFASGVTSAYINSYIQNSSFGVTTPHAASDILCSTQAGSLILVDSTLASTTQVSSQSSMQKSASVRLQKSGGVAGANPGYWKSGRSSTDAVIYDTSPYSMRLTPSSATLKLMVPFGSFNVASGSVVTITCKIRKSVVGDGVAYNGNQVRWWLKANAAAGSSYDSDILMATTSGAAGSWETLSYTLPSAVTDNTAFSMYFDCDGTAGWVNIDAFTVT